MEFLKSNVSYEKKIQDILILDWKAGYDGCDCDDEFVLERARFYFNIDAKRKWMKNLHRAEKKL